MKLLFIARPHNYLVLVPVCGVYQCFINDILTYGNVVIQHRNIIRTSLLGLCTFMHNNIFAYSRPSCVGRTERRVGLTCFFALSCSRFTFGVLLHVKMLCAQIIALEISPTIRELIKFLLLFEITI